MTSGQSKLDPARARICDVVGLESARVLERSNGDNQIVVLVVERNGLELPPATGKGVFDRRFGAEAAFRLECWIVGEGQLESIRWSDPRGDRATQLGVVCRARPDEPCDGRTRIDRDDRIRIQCFGEPLPVNVVESQAAGEEEAGAGCPACFSEVRRRAPLHLDLLSLHVGNEAAASALALQLEAGADVERRRHRHVQLRATKPPVRVGLGRTEWTRELAAEPIVCGQYQHAAGASDRECPGCRCKGSRVVDS